jgi:hypothetical protein
MQELFKADFVQYQLFPVRNYEDVVGAVALMRQGQDQARTGPGAS